VSRPCARRVRRALDRGERRTRRATPDWGSRRAKSEASPFPLTSREFVRTCAPEHGVTETDRIEEFHRGTASPVAATIRCNSGSHPHAGSTSPGRNAAAVVLTGSSIRPPSGVKRGLRFPLAAPQSRRSSVVLPVPDAPTRTINSPGSMVKSSRRRTTVSMTRRSTPKARRTAWSSGARWWRSSVRRYTLRT